MPALSVFGRRWLVAGDDLPGPAIFLATFHLVRSHQYSERNKKVNFFEHFAFNRS
jgi:hypothetical protein